MADSEVISVRIPKGLKRELKKNKIDYTRETRKFLENLVRRARLEVTMGKMIKTSASLKKPVTNLAAKIIREDREHGH
ncbi:MAG: antitoxin [Candidatus Parvarchaeota archaeon]|jgi:hypothetical protein|nr:antitoxin [Candidatus Parvarchaeota archaeon]MCL5420513.1 antitoxin [Candidatus Parvarchaeota archaeon]